MVRLRIRTTNTNPNEKSPAEKNAHKKIISRVDEKRMFPTIKNLPVTVDIVFEAYPSFTSSQFGR